MAQKSDQDRASGLLKGIALSKNFTESTFADDFDEMSKTVGINYDDIEKTIKELGYRDILLERVKAIIQSRLHRSINIQALTDLTTNESKWFSKKKDVSLNEFMEFYEMRVADDRAKRNQAKSKRNAAAILRKEENDRKFAENRAEMDRVYFEKRKKQLEEQEELKQSLARRRAKDEARTKEMEQTLKNKNLRGEDLTQEEEYIKEQMKQQIKKEIVDNYNTMTKGRYTLDTLSEFLKIYIPDDVEDAKAKANLKENTDEKIHKMTTLLSAKIHPDKHSGEGSIEQYKWEQIFKAMQSFKDKKPFTMSGSSRRTRRKSKRNMRSKSKRHVRKTRK
jgi:hypothetical protein